MTRFTALIILVICPLIASVSLGAENYYVGKMFPTDKLIAHKFIKLKRCNARQALMKEIPRSFIKTVGKIDVSKNTWQVYYEYKVTSSGQTFWDWIIQCGDRTTGYSWGAIELLTD